MSSRAAVAADDADTVQLVDHRCVPAMVTVVPRAALAGPSLRDALLAVRRPGGRGGARRISD